MRENEIQATTVGLIQCLRMLAEEASMLNLDRTVAALHGALQTCNLEISAKLIADPLGAIPPDFTMH